MTGDPATILESCMGCAVHAGRRTATAEGRVFAEADEKLIAHGSTGCVILG